MRFVSPSHQKKKKISSSCRNDDSENNLCNLVTITNDDGNNLGGGKEERRHKAQREITTIHETNHYHVVFGRMLWNPEVCEKYLLSSAVFFSAAPGLTISSPWSGVKATDDAVPDIVFLIVVVPPNVVFRGMGRRRERENVR